jgi:hypothetical protein
MIQLATLFFLLTDYICGTTLDATAGVIDISFQHPVI